MDQAKSNLALLNSRQQNLVEEGVKTSPSREPKRRPCKRADDRGCGVLPPKARSFEAALGKKRGRKDMVPRTRKEQLSRSGEGRDTVAPYRGEEARKGKRLKGIRFQEVRRKLGREIG